MRVLREHGEIFLGRDYLTTHDVSQPTLEHLDSEVSRILDEEEEAARSILQAHRRLLERLTADLLNQETLPGAELSQILAEVSPYVRPGSAASSNGGSSPRAAVGTRVRRSST